MRAFVAAVLLAAATPAVAQVSQFHLSGPAVQGGLIRGTVPAGTTSLSLEGRDVPLAPDGRFLLGFDRDARSSATLVARTADGRELRETLRVAARAWSIQHVDLPRPEGGPTPEYARLREGELRLIGAARAQRSPSMGWSQHFLWPAHGRLSGGFGAQRIYRGGVPAAFHSGADIAAGTPPR